jgi:hypothetical protein
MHAWWVDGWAQNSEVANSVICRDDIRHPVTQSMMKQILTS